MQKQQKRGAVHLIDALIDGGVNHCFANPGTSEMHFISALDQSPEMRAVLCLFEGVVTGAADGYGRMARKPAATLLHLGPGLANGLANLHNAKRGGSPVVNIIGEHARDHIQYDSPLTTDIEAIAAPFSSWVGCCSEPSNIKQSARDAIKAAKARPGCVASLILPADIAWTHCDPAAAANEINENGDCTDETSIKEAAKLLAGSGNTLLLIGSDGLLETGLLAAGRIATSTGAELLAPTHCARIERGEGRVDIARIPYPVPQALDRLKDFDTVILAGATEPVAFFAYPDKPSRLLQPSTHIFQLASRSENITDALEQLADMVSPSGKEPLLETRNIPMKPEGSLTAEALALSVAAHMPENAIIADESISSGRAFFQLTRGAPVHSWLPTASGSIGIGLPMSIGAAIACPDRRIINLQADGSAMYTLQSLWTMAREKLDVVTIILANRGYAILRGEMTNVGLGNPGPVARDLLEVDRPELDWVSLAKGMGVEATSAEDCRQFNDALEHALNRTGPFLIEARLAGL